MPSYSTTHRWLSQARGRPSTHACVECGGCAEEWAYDHADPNELTSSKGPYSPQYGHYQPMCRRCHRLFDASHAKKGEA